MTTRRICTWGGAGLAFLALLATGCGLDPFGAPARPSSRPDPATQSAPASKAIFLVIPSAPTTSQEVWSILAQREANSEKAIYRMMVPAPGQTASDQPEVVRKAVDDGASALIVVPGDSPELGRSLVEAESRNVPVVLLGGSIPSPSGVKPFTLVEHEPFDGPARKIVDATSQDAKKAGRPPEGTVILLTDRVTDRTSGARQAALKAAVESAGLRPVVSVSFDGAATGAAKAAVLDAIGSHPDVFMVLADEGEGILGASQARVSLGGRPAFFVGGFAGYRGSLNAALLEKESCFVEGRVEDLARLAVITALKKSRGEPVEGRVDLPSLFHRGGGEVASPVDPGPGVTAEKVKKMVDEVMSRNLAPVGSAPHP